MAYDITNFIGILNIEDLKNNVMNVGAYFNRDDNDPYAKKSSMIIIDELQVLEDTDWTDSKIEGTCNSYAQACADYSGVEVEAVYPLGINAALPICLPDRSDTVARQKLVSVLKNWALAEIKYGYTQGAAVWTKVTDLPNEIATGSSTDGTTNTTSNRPANVLDEIAYILQTQVIEMDLNVNQFTLYLSAAKALELRTLKQQCCDIATMTADMTSYAANNFGLANVIEIPAAANPGIDMALYYTPYQWLKVFCDTEPYVDRNTGVNVIAQDEYAIKGMETIGFKSIKPEWAFFAGTAGAAAGTTPQEQAMALKDMPEAEAKEDTPKVEAKGSKKASK